MLASHAHEPSSVTINSNSKNRSQIWLGAKASPRWTMACHGPISECGNDVQQYIMASMRGKIGRLGDKSIPALVLSGEAFPARNWSSMTLDHTDYRSPHVRGLGPASQPIECSHLMLHSWDSAISV